MSKKKIDKYRIVVGKHVSRNPFRHKTYTEAFQESSRLALKRPKDIFTVFESICSSVHLRLFQILKKKSLPFGQKLKRKF